LSQALDSDFKLSATSPIKSSLRFDVRSKIIKIKINFLTHLSQDFGTDFKLSATRPIKNSLRFEDQSQRMKKKLKSNSCEPSLGLTFQALGNKTNKKQLEV
jgi:hypothetical protein